MSKKSWGWITVIFFLGGVGHIFMAHPVLEPFAEGVVAIAIAALCSLKYFTNNNENQSRSAVNFTTAEMLNC